MKTPAPADLQRWSEEVARDPSSLAFLPLARAYRRLGQRAAALQLCTRGLTHYPTHADAHSLLAMLYLEDGQRDRAADEWSTVLRLDPDHFEALRGLGFCYLEQDQLSKARHTLERAALLRPADPTVQEALRLLGAMQATADPAPPPPEPTPAEPRFALVEERAEPAPAAPAWASTPAAAPAPPPGSAALAAGDPARLFAALGSGGPILGALLLDAHGLVLAGSLDEAVSGEAESLGALLGGAIAEAARTVTHLGIGAWHGILLETESALLHLSPAGDGVVLLAARRTAPAGWVLRTAAHARELAGRYLEAYA